MVARSWMALPIMHRDDKMKITPRITQALRRKRDRRKLTNQTHITLPVPTWIARTNQQ